MLKPHLTLLRTPAPDEIYGRKLDHFAHKADVVRLQALQYTGGIYLDIDVYGAVLSCSSLFHLVSPSGARWLVRSKANCPDLKTPSARQ